MKTMCRIRDRRSALFVVLVLCCAGIVVRAHNGLKSEAVPTYAAASPQPAFLAIAQAGARGPVQVVRFALYDVGIYPREAQARNGLVAILFEDLSGGVGDLIVTRETGAAPESIGRVQRAGQNSRGRSDLRLEPGRYQIYVADHPENRATLTVE